MKVKLIGQASSKGRGVGFYHEFLKKTLSTLPEIELVNQNQDLVHYTFYDLFFHTLPFKKEIPTVVTIHDLTPLVLPQLYPRGIKGNLNLFLQRLSLKNIAAVITDSDNSKKDLVDYFHLNENKVFVTPLAVDPIFKKTLSRLKLKQIAKKYRLPADFVLTVTAGPNPNKNLPLLAKATNELHIPLVIVGGGMLQKVTNHAELKDLKALRTYKHIITPSFIPTEDLLGFYKLADVYSQSSLYEGFGLPLLEAMTAGCLCISSNTSSLPEIYPKKTITFNPYHYHDLLSSLEKALNLKDHFRQTYVRALQHKASDYAWLKTAQKTLAVYNQVLNQ